MKLTAPQIRAIIAEEIGCPDFVAATPSRESYCDAETPNKFGKVVGECFCLKAATRIEHEAALNEVVV